MSSVQGFNVGRDVTVTVIAGGQTLRLGLVTEFQRKQDSTDFKVKGMDGITRNIIFPDGWSGSFKLDRRNSIVDDYIAALEAGYYQGIAAVPGSITETINEVSGTNTQYRYTNVVFKLTDAGTWKGDSTVKMSLDFMAEKRLKVA